MQAEFRCRQRFFCERRFHCCWVRAPILPDAASFLKAGKKCTDCWLFPFVRVLCMNWPLVLSKTDFFTIHPPLGIAWNLGFPEVRDRCFGVCAAPLDSAQHSMVTVVEELGEKFLREASSSHALTNQADLRTRVLTQT